MENNTYKDKIMTALDSLEKTLNMGLDKVKESTNKGIDKIREEAVLEEMQQAINIAYSNHTKENWHSWNKVFSPGGPPDVETFVKVIAEMIKV